MIICLKRYCVLLAFLLVSVLQGNGHERDFMGDDRVYILDVYNRNIYPHDGYAKRKKNGSLI